DKELALLSDVVDLIKANKDSYLREKWLTEEQRAKLTGYLPIMPYKDREVQLMVFDLLWEAQNVYSTAAMLKKSERASLPERIAELVNKEGLIDVTNFSVLEKGFIDQ